MVHRMRLVDFAFKSIKNKEKDDEIFNKFDHKRLGLKDSDNSSIMNNFYTIEEQNNMVHLV